MRKMALPLALAWAFAGCAGASNPALTPDPGSTQALPGVGGLGSEVIAGGSVHTALGIYRVTLDPATQTAVAELRAQRDLQQSELYSLAIDNFLKPDTLAIEGVSWTPTTVDIHYRTKHPFPKASNLDGPASAGNREDLAVTGRVVWLLDDPDPATYFAGDGNVRVNTRWAMNPDGYFTPGALIDSGTLLANTFPYQVLVDESADNRDGLSNGGTTVGNFTPTSWSKADFATGITGYGIWAQGQTSSHTISLNRAAMASEGPIVMDAAIIVKYEDPRGGSSSTQKRANRLPSDDMTRFAYRMPHGALDVEAIEVLNVGSGLAVGAPGGAILEARVRDWDARATEAASVNLSAETDATLVSQGESGLPTIQFDVPTITATAGGLTVADDDSAHSGDIGPDAGSAGDELFFTGSIVGTPTTEGDITGLIRAVDITDTTPPGGWGAVRYNLDPNLINLGTSIEGATFQAFTVNVADPGVPPASSWTFLNGIQTVTGIGLITVELATPILSPTNTSGDYTVEIDFGEMTVPPVNENISSGPRNYNYTYTYTGTPPTPQVRTITVNLIDGDDPSLEAFATPPASPDVTVHPPFIGWARRWGSTGFDMGLSTAVGPDGTVVVGGMYNPPSVDFGGGPRNSLGGTAFVVKLDPYGTYLWDRQFDGTTGQDRNEGLHVAADGAIYACGSYDGTVNLGGGIRTGFGAQDGYVVKLTAGGNWVWDTTWGTAATDANYGIARDAAGDVLVTGYCYGFGLNLGGGPLPGYPMYVGKLNSGSGAYVAHYAVTGNGGFGTSIDEVPGGGYIFGGFYAGTSDFGGGPRTSFGSNDIFAVKLTPGMAHQWDYVAGSPSVEYMWGSGVASQSTGNIFIGGEFSATANFGGTMKTSVGGQDMFLVTLNSSGVQTNVTTWGTSGFENLRGPWVDANDNLFLAGGVGGSVSLGGPAISGMFVAKFSPAGVWQWQHAWPGGGGYCYGVSGDLAGNPCAAGLYGGSSDFEPGPGVTTLTSGGSYDAFVIRLRGSDGLW